MTICSGIGAPEVAAPFIDWRYQSEIEGFPRAVLKSRFPDATNLGDMTKFKEWPDYAIDLLCGGTPCQSFSVAGLRKGMADPRGNLALIYLAIADRYRPEWLLWENVPGVLSSNDGRDFGAFLGGLAELGYGFAYRVLDAQYIRVESHPFAVPQRRRRVIVVAHSGDWRRAAAVLFERESLSGHPPPRRQTGERIAPTIRSGAPNGGPGHGARSSDSKDELIVPTWPAQVAPTLHTSWAERSPGSQAQEWDSQKGGHFVAGEWPAEVASTLNAAFGDKQGLEDQHAMNGAPLFVPGVVGALTAKGPEANGAPEVDAGHYIISSGQANATVNKDIASALDCLHEAPIVAHTLRAEHDATEDGTGRGTPLVTTYRTAGDGAVYEEGNKSAPLTTNTDPNTQVLTLAIRGRGDSDDLEYRSDGTANAILTPNGGRGGIGVGAVAFAQNQRDELRLMDAAGSLAADPGMKQQTYIQQSMAVRRLTPLECERLQGFPDGWTAIEGRSKPAADGPRYKALGNSMACNTMNWLLTRIHENHQERLAA